MDLDSARYQQFEVNRRDPHSAVYLKEDENDGDDDDDDDDADNWDNNDKNLSSILLCEGGWPAKRFSTRHKHSTQFRRKIRVNFIPL